MAVPTAIAVLLTVADVAARLVVNDEIVLTHIRAGRLRAINVGLGTQRPRWRISPEALDEFIAARTATPCQAATRQRRRRSEHVTEFF